MIKNMAFLLVLSISAWVNADSLLESQVCDNIIRTDNDASLYVINYCRTGSNDQICGLSRQRPVSHCSITEFNDVELEVEFEYHNFFYRNVNSKIQGDVRCIFSNFYTWECLYKNNWSAWKSVTGVVRPYGESFQEMYLRNLSRYLNENY